MEEAFWTMIGWLVMGGIVYLCVRPQVLIDLLAPKSQQKPQYNKRKQREMEGSVKDEYTPPKAVNDVLDEEALPDACYCNQPPVNVPQTMYLAAEQTRVKKNYHNMLTSTVQVEWVGMNDSANRRIPEEQERQYAKGAQLVILGQGYPALFGASSCFKNMTHAQWGIDVYGRDIICFRDRFPCFDSEDYLNENRYFYWYFIREGDRLARVFYEDDRDVVIVTDDVRYIETDCWRFMQEAGFCQLPKS